MDNYNYPLGADTKNAPWNQHDLEALEFEVAISQSLSKTATVTTTDYEEEEDYDDCLNQKILAANTSNTDWHEVYKECHYEPYGLITLLKDILTTGKLPSERERRDLIKECEDWVIDETVVCQ